MNTAQLWWGLLFGAIGTGYIVYARRQRAAVALVSGLLLVVVPYAISNAFALVVAGVVLCALPFVLRG